MVERISLHLVILRTPRSRQRHRKSPTKSAMGPTYQPVALIPNQRGCAQSKKQVQHEEVAKEASNPAGSGPARTPRRTPENAPPGPAGHLLNELILGDRQPPDLLRSLRRSGFKGRETLHLRISVQYQEQSPERPQEVCSSPLKCLLHVHSSKDPTMSFQVLKAFQSVLLWLTACDR